MKRINYGNVAATLALVFAMSGGAVAATGVVSSNARPARHYVITSITQISPRVLRELRDHDRGEVGERG